MGLLDSIARGFEAALGQGFQALHHYSLPLLGALALIHLYMTWSAVVAHGAHGGNALAEGLFLMLRIGIFYWLLLHLWTIGMAALQTFVQWGGEAGGGTVTVATFLHPSAIWEMGWVVAAPIDDFISHHSGWAILWNAPDLLFYALAKLVIIVAFFAASLTVLLTIIEFFLALVAGAILIPWGVLSATSSLCEFALSWLVGGCIRSFLTALILAIGQPMLVNLPIPTTAGGDPTLFGACTVAAAAVVLAVLVAYVPKRAAMVAGRGMALGLDGSLLSGGVLTGWRTAVAGVRATQGAVQGISRLVNAS